jgi:hypothetical protein
MALQCRRENPPLHLLEGKAVFRFMRSAPDQPQSVLPMAEVFFQPLSLKEDAR